MTTKQKLLEMLTKQWDKEPDNTDLSDLIVDIHNGHYSEEAMQMLLDTQLMIEAQMKEPIICNRKAAQKIQDTLDMFKFVMDSPRRITRD